MPAESVRHLRLVADLTELLRAAGFAVTEVAVSGERQPRTFAGHRPDLLAQQW